MQQKTIFGAKPIINLNVPPHIPEGLHLERHERGGFFAWDTKRVLLLPFSFQSYNCIHYAYKLCYKKSDGSIMEFNANALDWLIEHQSFILDEWKLDEQGNIRYLYCPCTKYRRQNSGRCLRYLYWKIADGRWDSHNSLIELNSQSTIDEAGSCHKLTLPADSQ